MDKEKMVSDSRAAIMAGTALILGAFYVFFGVDWYNKGHMVLCYCELSVDPHSWCFSPDAPQSEDTSTAPLSRYESSPNMELNPQTSIRDLLTTGLGPINRCYKGLTETREYENSYSHRFALWWNSMFLTDADRRMALAGVLTAIYTAFLGLTASVLKDWLQSR
jgi:hypothetical protein